MSSSSHIVLKISFGEDLRRISLPRTGLTFDGLKQAVRSVLLPYFMLLFIIGMFIPAQIFTNVDEDVFQTLVIKYRDEDQDLVTVAVIISDFD